MLPFAIMIISMTFVLQLVLCFRTGKIWIKLIPLCLIGVGELVCAAGYFLFDHIYGAAFASVIYAILLLIILSGDGLAWLVYFVVRKAQKSK